MREPNRLDYPIHDQVSMMQGRILGMILSPDTLMRLRDSEVKVAGDGDLYTLAEHLRLITDGVFSEVREPLKDGEYTARKPYINSFRRNLQRHAVREFSAVAAINFSDVPEDARSLARMHLKDLKDQIGKLLAAPNVKLDDYTKSHLLDLQERITQILDAKVVSSQVP